MECLLPYLCTVLFIENRPDGSQSVKQSVNSRSSTPVNWPVYDEKYRMVTVPHIMVGLERMLDYRGAGLERFHCKCIVCTFFDG